MPARNALTILIQSHFHQKKTNILTFVLKFSNLRFSKLNQNKNFINKLAKLKDLLILKLHLLKLKIFLNSKIFSKQKLFAALKTFSNCCKFIENLRIVSLILRPRQIQIPQKSKKIRTIFKVMGRFRKWAFAIISDTIQIRHEWRC